MTTAATTTITRPNPPPPTPPAAEDEPDILAPLFGQLDFLNMDAVYVLNFSLAHRTLHETRVPTLLLDWARTVMLNDWDGSPVVPGDGPFGGALALVEAMCKKFFFLFFFLSFFPFFLSFLERGS